MPSPESQKIMLIIIDQLRADYLSHFKKCSSLLPYQAVCSTNSFPASTESMHANISTGVYPAQHGFISKNTKNGAEGLEQLIQKVRKKELRSLASLGLEYGFAAYIIGGKQETVRVMGAEEDCAAMIFYDRNKNKFILKKAKDNLVEKMEDFLEESRYKKVQQKELDKPVLEIAKKIITLNELTSSFFILTLASLDSIGHEFGPHSNEVYKHLELLDNLIYSLIEETNPSSVIITGDHGCRTVSRYIIEPENTSGIQVYCVQGQEIKPYEKHRLKSAVDNLQYDGGLLRIWMNDGKDITPGDLSFFSKYGFVFPHYIKQGLTNEEIIRLYNNSIHENIGDIFAIAANDTMFCKRTWIRDEILYKVSKKAILSRENLPIGEHGTYGLEDIQVCLLSNKPTKTIIENVEIYEMIKTMMKS